MAIGKVAGAEASQVQAKPSAQHSTFWSRLRRGAWHVRQEDSWALFTGLDWLREIMDLPAASDFHVKQGRSTGQVVLEASGHRLSIYLKRHYRLPLLDGLRALFRPGKSHSPALHEWDHLQAARQAGLPVPAPLAAGELIGPWGRLQSFLAIEELTGMLALHQAIPAAADRLDGATFAHWKRGLIREMARLAHELHRRSWFHTDFYLCHFFISEEDLNRCPSDWHGRVFLIDFHRLRRNHWLPLLSRSKDLGQLLYSSELSGVSARDRLRFWREYLQMEDLTGLTGRLLWRLLMSKAWVYRRNHRRKRRATLN